MRFRLRGSKLKEALVVLKSFKSDYGYLYATNGRVFVGSSASTARAMWNVELYLKSAVEGSETYSCINFPIAELEAAAESIEDADILSFSIGNYFSIKGKPDIHFDAPYNVPLLVVGSVPFLLSPDVLFLIEAVDAGGFDMLHDGLGVAFSGKDTLSVCAAGAHCVLFTDTVVAAPAKPVYCGAEALAPFFGSKRPLRVTPAYRLEVSTDRNTRVSTVYDGINILCGDVSMSVKYRNSIKFTKLSDDMFGRRKRSQVAKSAFLHKHGADLTPEHHVIAKKVLKTFPKDITVVTGSEDSLMIEGGKTALVFRR